MIEDYQALSNASNSADLNGKYLGIISADFVIVADILKDASYQIRKRGFSEYPVFVCSQNDLAIGQKLLNMNEFANNRWNYSASMMEEFTQREIIAQENIEVFKGNYKNPDEYACLFVYDGQFASFVYIPFPEE
ncbi:MAG: hypothetical protein KA313_01515 [Pseudarcicella sp.]|nr:hypothetical protein [Pseudarcicella sp.]MBP6409754.1 hypothetical protein [Pseudarcicella sp.]